MGGISEIVLIVLLLIGAVALGWTVYDRALGRDIPTYASDEDNFLYGSLGNEGTQGLPFPIWLVLPKVFPDLLPGPGGYTSIGMYWAKDAGPHDPPVGFSKARVGVERMAINCALCHAPTVRMSEQAPRVLLPGGASNRLDIQAYQRFLSAAAADPRFTADNIIPAIQREMPLSFVERQLYRYLLIPITRDTLLTQRDAFVWTTKRPRWGPGRIDPFNPVKFGMLEMGDDGTIGNSDMQTVWNLDERDRLRPGGPYHWDGLNTSLREVFDSSALGDGTDPNHYPTASLRRMENYLRRLKPPPSPHRPDPVMVSRGAAVFAASCASCHAPNGARVLTLIPAAEVGTDPHRLAMWSDAALKTYSRYRKGRDWDFKSFQNVEGYIAQPLWALWSTGPFLHNGSVPTLTDLLKPPAERPVAFLRHSDVLDGVNGGFVSPPCDPAGRYGEGFCLDTRVAGNSNAGHLWGTDLSSSQKADLVAYLLTL